MTKTHGIGRRCENESTLGVRVLSWAIFETLGSKISHETRVVRLLAAPQPKAQSL